MTGPWEDYTAPDDVASMVTAEAQRQGVDPGLAVRVATQESRLHHGAVSPAGAVGVMQLMPGTAADMGVDPTDLADNIKGGVGYLKQQIDTFHDPRLAAAAYNAGPGAVQKYGGVPPFPETQKYVDAVAPQGADAPPWMDYADSAPVAPTASPATVPQEVGASHNRGVTISVEPRAPGAPPRPSPTIAQDAASGFAQPFVDLGHEVMQNLRAHGNPHMPTSASDVLDSLAAPARLLGGVGGLVAAIPNMAVRPIARAINSALPGPTIAPQLSFVNGKPVLSAPRQLQGPEAQAAVEQALNTSLMGARAAAPRPTGLPTGKPMTLEQVEAAKNAAYAKVDASGFAFPQQDVQNLAQDIAGKVAAKGGPSGAKLYPDSTAMVDRITALADQPNGVPLTQLESLRSDIYDALVAPGGKESTIGRMMRQQIDGLINASNTPDIQQARDLNTRFMKMQSVTDKLDSAGLRSASTYSGGNYNNAVRQTLRPLVDPTSSQQIRNLSPAESAALRRAVQGTATQNATRYATKILTNKMVQAPVALMTHGAGPAVMEAAGTILNHVGQNQTISAVQKVLDLMSQGGKAAQAAPVYPTLALGGRPALSILSPAGLVGGTAVATLPARLRALGAPPSKTAGASAPAR